MPFFVMSWLLSFFSCLSKFNRSLEIESSVSGALTSLTWFETTVFVDVIVLPVEVVVLAAVFDAGDETAFFTGDAAAVFRTVEVALLLLNLETVDARLVTELVLVAVVAVLDAVVVLVVAACPTVLTLLVTVLDDP